MMHRTNTQNKRSIHIDRIYTVALFGKKKEKKKKPLQFWYLPLIFHGSCF
jgi:hypothetical protein